MKTYLLVKPNGEIVGVKNDITLDILADEFGQAQTRRATNVTPTHPGKRFAFRLLRALFGESGSLAEWCRSWEGPWEVRFVESPNEVAFTHQCRRVCIKWEIGVLNQRIAKN